MMLDGRCLTLCPLDACQFKTLLSSLYTFLLIPSLPLNFKVDGKMKL